ncbi:G-type lectin S-receptor-like serine/threonine-protein kinase At4g27290 isoform X1 [Quercus robur]|uniref:G-type lectin S-receptor-like serine/threonine-protein kinase At4g27290 isoform X1 n=1 Tax=Quercus robur TaxID=38942 RepID=UPI00216175E3|nr:G-type lectin S-receptor-like serine/threonine-protein kinase At4g27290 isoform X1 [Quercus robur]
MDISVFVFLSSSFFLFYFVFSHATDNITGSQFLSDREATTLVSKDGGFVLGFFSPGDSTNRYLGIWYNNIPIKTVVWVANRHNPITDSSGVLMVSSSGSLVLLNQNSTVVWLANSTKEAGNSMVQLLDSGNLVLREVHEENPENYLWQSFDYPSDTWLPGMKLGWDLRTGLERRLTAWKSPDDPSPGELSWGIELHNYPEFVMEKGSKMYFRTGPWNGLGFSGVPEVRANAVFNFSFFSNKDEVYFIFNIIQHSVISRSVLNQTQYERYIWDNGKWSLYLHFPRDECDTYNLCGVYGNCIISESPICQCIQGFKPKSAKTWIPDEWSKGCVRSTQLSCQDKEKIGFVKFVGYKLPDTTYSWVNQSMNLEECRVKCLNNCSCMAYSNSDIKDGPDGGSGCVIWYGDLIDFKPTAANRQDIYIRMPASEQVKGKQKMKVIVIVVVAIASVFGVLWILYCLCKMTSLRDKMENNVMIGQNIEGQREDLEVPFFSLATIATATNNFSINNKLGEGGFGHVYKGTLTDGQEIAVKRLSQSSVQGLNEFKNEVTLIAKLQHRNLVRLLGYCIEGHETILIYEYMPNRSLDSFIFDQTRAGVLGWSMRFNIICGIARGLLYLHEDSRLRIIHRDLKASNILLDSNMIPKISDFGMAKIFGGDQTEGNTNRVVGTYGYMAPEYAIDGLYSVKSDVFSFGILLLEILSGKKNRGSFHPSHGQNLVGNAWKLWKEGKPLELIDTCLKDSCILLEIVRCLRISFLCLQQHPEDRPNMSSVVMMLHDESSLPEPKEPASFVGKKSSSSRKNQSSSTNEITVTLLEAR